MQNGNCCITSHFHLFCQWIFNDEHWTECFNGRCEWTFRNFELKLLILHFHCRQKRIKQNRIFWNIFVMQCLSQWITLPIGFAYNLNKSTYWMFIFIKSHRHRWHGHHFDFIFRPKRLMMHSTGQLNKTISYINMVMIK